MVALGLALLALRTRRRARLAFFAFVAVAAASAALVAQRHAAATADRALARGVRTLEGELRAGSGGGIPRLEIERVRPVDGGGALPARVLLQARDPGAPAPVASGRLRARVSLEVPVGARNPGARDRARELARRGIGAIARPVDPLLVVPVETGGLRVAAVAGLASLRARVGSRLAATGRGGELLRALASGERAGLPPELRADFSELGLTHVLSVSGLHLVLVAGLAYGIAVRALGRLRGPGVRAPCDVRRAALAVAVCVSALYALFSGFEVPVQRSLAIVVAGALALGRRRPLAAGTALLAAAGGVLAATPDALFDAGAQMSFAACVALVLARREEGAAEAAGHAARGLRAARDLLSASAAAGAATAPLAATHIGVVSPAGLLTNLLLVPWTGLVLLPAALAGALVATLPSGRATDAALDALSLAGEWTCGAVASLATTLPDAPAVGAPGPAVLATTVALAAVAVRGRTLARRAAAACASAAILAASPPADVTPAAPRVVFLDVGQGDATLVEGREGTLLVDAGLATAEGLDLGRSVVLPALAALGVRRLDVLAVTHGDLDHRGGASAVLEAIPVGEVWVPAGAGHEAAFAGLREVAMQRGVAVRECSADAAPRRLGDLRVEVLWPPAVPAGGAGSKNDRSLVLRVAADGTRVLLPGDLERAGERALLAGGADVESEVLKLPHHGSRTSTSAELLAAVRPRLAVASAACGGRFGMPHPEVVARLEAARVDWRWTGRDGAVAVPLARTGPVRTWLSPPADCAPGVRRAAW